MFDPEESQSSATPATAKRRVEISYGVPEMLTGIETAKHGHMPDPDECYFINFVDAPDADGIGQNGFYCQALCLCTLKEATTAWLNGATEEETKAAIASNDKDHDEGDDHNEDNDQYDHE